MTDLTKLPRRRDVHLEDADLSEQEVVPAGVKKTPVENRSPARWLCERMILCIQTFE